VPLPAVVTNNAEPLLSSRSPGKTSTTLLHDLALLDADLRKAQTETDESAPPDETGIVFVFEGTGRLRHAIRSD
jgi:hypothetical protein